MSSLNWVLLTFNLIIVAVKCSVHSWIWYKSVSSYYLASSSWRIDQTLYLIFSYIRLVVIRLKIVLGHLYLETVTVLWTRNLTRILILKFWAYYFLHVCSLSHLKATFYPVVFLHSLLRCLSQEPIILTKFVFNRHSILDDHEHEFR